MLYSELVREKKVQTFIEVLLFLRPDQVESIDFLNSGIFYLSLGTPSVTGASRGSINFPSRHYICGSSRILHSIAPDLISIIDFVTS